MHAGRVLSVTWSPEANKIYSGSSDGYVFYTIYQDMKNVPCVLPSSHFSILLLHKEIIVFDLK